MDDTATAIMPGARVRTRTGIIGTVERVEPDAEHEATGSLLVCADDGASRYRVPLLLVAGMTEEADPAIAYTVVHLALDTSNLDRYVVRDGSGQDTIAPGETLGIPLAAEELVAETRPVQRGTVRLHKSVETVEQALTAPVTREDVIVERIPADQYDASVPADPDETIIPVVEERLVVEIRAVIVEYVRVRKRRVTEDQEVRAPVRREVVTIQEMGAAGGQLGPPLVRGAVDAGRSQDTAP